MELHERIVTTQPKASAAPLPKEPFADLKNEIHMLVITELGPQMTGQVFDAVAMRDRVLADIRRHLSSQTGISRDDRERLTAGGPGEGRAAAGRVGRRRFDGAHPVAAAASQFGFSRTCSSAVRRSFGVFTVSHRPSWRNA